MPLPVIADVLQVTLNWRGVNAQRDASTTFHLWDTAGGSGANAAYAVLNTYVTAGMWNLVGNAAVNAVRITPLDGVTAGSVFATGSPAKWAGSTPSADDILQGAMVVSFRSSRRGPRGRNRLFLPFISEAKQTNGTLDAGSVTAAAAAWTTFLTNMQTATFPLTVASPTDLAHYPVSSIVFPAYMKTQRRRARR